MQFLCADTCTPSVHIFVSARSARYYAIELYGAQAAQSYPVLLITLYLYINSILKIIRKSCVIYIINHVNPNYGR